jgi:hypothetical protein
MEPPRRSRVVTPAGTQTELARYELPGGVERIVVGQRIGGHVAISDIPAGDDGRVFLVERHIESKDAMAALVADYVAESRERGEPAILVPRTVADDDRD